MENTMIIIPFILKGYRLEAGEKVRFRCLFKTANGDLPYVLYLAEDNMGADGSGGHYTVTLDTKAKGILPGRYRFSLELVLGSGSSVTLKRISETGIDIIPALNDKE